jgi:hypothetical protein
VYDVKVVSSRDVWALIGHWDGDGRLIRWDGKRWRTVRIPLPGEDRVTVDRLFIFAGRNIWVIGTAQRESDLRSHVFAVHGDGSHWRLSKSPPLGVSGNGNLALNDAAAFAPDAIWAVGSEGGAGAYYPFAVYWDGRTWLDTRLPVTVDIAWEEAAAITVLSSRSAWGLRWGIPPDGSMSNPQEWVDRWNGSHWTVASTDIGGSAIDATANNDVWVVAEHGKTSITLSHWNGRTWNLLRPPRTPQGPGNFTPDLAALSPSDVWVVWGRAVLHFSG